MIKFKKKGLSEVVAVVLIILLTVAAMAILARFLIPFVQNNLDSSSECLPYKDYFKFKETFIQENQEKRYNCFDKTNGLTGSMIEVTTNISAELPEGFSIVYYKGAQTKSLQVKSTGGSSEIRMLGGSSSIQIPRQGEVYTYVLREIPIPSTTYDTVEIYPILKSGKTCEKSGSIKLIACESNLLN